METALEDAEYMVEELERLLAPLLQLLLFFMKYLALNVHRAKWDTERCRLKIKFVLMLDFLKQVSLSCE